MGSSLPRIEPPAFVAELERLSPVELDADALNRLWIHYQELARWNPRLSLVGPGGTERILERHYGESLAGLAFLEPGDRLLVDVGSGAGFPGWVLAAARPDLAVTLVEARQKKWSFLSLVSEKAALPCRCLNARVGAVLPEEFPTQIDVVTWRAWRPAAAELSALAGRLSDSGRFLVWIGREVPESLARTRPGRRRDLPEAEHRAIRELYPVWGNGRSPTGGATPTESA